MDLSIRKVLAILLVAVPIVVGANDFAPSSHEEGAIYEALGPIYKQIYIQALNEEQRQRVIAYVKKGLNPYEALNTILRVEERRFLRSLPKLKKITPADHSLQRVKPRRDILFEDHS